MNNDRKVTLRSLTKENRRIVMQIEQYIECRYINEIAREEILSDIIGMALECQERGDSFSDMIGDDHEAFCKELIRNSPKQFFHERILHVLHWLLLFATLLLPGLFVIELLFSKYSPGEVVGVFYTVRLSYILKYYILMAVFVIGWFSVRMYNYKPMKYVFGAYFAVLMIFFLFTDAVLKFIVGEHIVAVNIIVWTLSVAAVLVICDLARRVIAMSIAYKRKKTNIK